VAPGFHLGSAFSSGVADLTLTQYLRGILLLVEKVRTIGYPLLLVCPRANLVKHYNPLTVIIERVYDTKVEYSMSGEMHVTR
jgi:hypothetical protein